MKSIIIIMALSFSFQGLHAENLGTLVSNLYAPEAMGKKLTQHLIEFLVDLRMAMGNIALSKEQLLKLEIKQFMTVVVEPLAERPAYQPFFRALAPNGTLNVESLNNAIKTLPKASVPVPEAVVLKFGTMDLKKGLRDFLKFNPQAARSTMIGAAAGIGAVILSKVNPVTDLGNAALAEQDDGTDGSGLLNDFPGLEGVK